MLLDVFGGLVEPSLCLLGPWEVGPGTRVTLSYSSLSPPSLWSVLLDVLPIYLCVPFLWSVLLDVLPNCLHALLSLWLPFPSSQVCLCLTGTLMGAGETDLEHLTLRPSNPPPAHLHLNLVSSWAGVQALLSAPLWPCPLPGCTRPQRVVGRQPRLRTGQLTNAGTRCWEPPPHRACVTGRVGAGPQPKPSWGAEEQEQGHLRVTLRAWGRAMGHSVYPGLVRREGS